MFVSLQSRVLQGKIGCRQTVPVTHKWATQLSLVGAES
jgi:hypothetical protein